MKKLLNLLVILFVVWSCKQNGDKTIKIIKVDPERSDSIKLSDIALSVDKVLLESNEASLITRIQGIAMTDQYLFVNDAGTRVLQFDSSGKFIKQIGRAGRGPGEYLGIISLAIDSNNKLVYVASFRKIFCYDFSGNLVKVIRQESMLEFITVVNDTLWAISTKMTNKPESNTWLNITTLTKYQSSGNSIDSFIIKKISLTGFAGTINPQAFYISDIGSNQFLYYPVLLQEPLTRDTIYEIKRYTLISSKKLDFGDAAKPKNGKKQVYLRNIFETKKYLFVEYIYNNNHMFFCYDYSGNDRYYGNQGFIDDFFKTGVIQLCPLNLERGTLYFTKDAFEVVGKVEGVTENSNPVIFIARLKSDN
jgi:hypothetical protein